MLFSIIMPVLNEATILEQQLINLQHACAHYDYELLIVDGGSTDDTPRIGQRYGQMITAPGGRSSQLNAGATAAQGDVLLFLHADTTLPRNALALIEHYLNSNSVVGGAFCLRFDRGNLAYRLVALSTNLRSRLFQIYSSNQAYFIRHSSFKAIGGYPDTPWLEDQEITRKLRKQGLFILLSQPVISSAYHHQQAGLLTNIFLMWYIRILYRMGISPPRLQRIYENVR